MSSKEKKSPPDYSMKYYTKLLLEVGNWDNPKDMNSFLKRQLIILVLFAICGVIYFVAWLSLRDCGNKYSSLGYNAWVLFFTFTIFLYAFFDALLIHIYWKNFKSIWEKTKIFDKKEIRSKRVLKKCIIAYNIIWITIIICFKKILDKGHMEILFKNGFDTITSVCIAIPIWPVIISCIHPFLKNGVEIMMRKFPDFVGIHTYTNLLILFLFILFRKFQRVCLYLLLKLGTARTKNDAKRLQTQICDKLDIIALMLIWGFNFVFKLGKYNSGTFISYFIDGIFYTSALFTAWITLKEKLKQC